MNGDRREYEELKGGEAMPEASEWVVRMAYGFTPEEQDAFFEWLAQDPSHAESFQTRSEAWKRLDALAQWRPEHTAKPNPDLLDTTASVKRRSVRNVVGLLGGIAALLTLGFVGMQYFSDTSEVRLAKGPYAVTHERHVLDDGSIVKLNKGAQAIVSFTSERRRIDLIRGEAHFNIAKDAARPFVVNANGVVVQAVGTMFNVLLDDRSVGVTVTEGRVLVGQKSKKCEVLKQEALGLTGSDRRTAIRCRRPPAGFASKSGVDFQRRNQSATDLAEAFRLYRNTAFRGGIGIQPSQPANHVD